ncbi:hypothetical protein OAO39_02150 [Pirellulaceae bacterium]|jgi:hypothetical protein|nr:hypothetical protein [Pirellulaceae bacterium]
MLRFQNITLRMLFILSMNCVNGADQYMTMRVIDVDTQRGSIFLSPFIQSRLNLV